MNASTTPTMTSEEVKKMKAELSFNICNMLVEFETKTGFNIHSIEYLTSMETTKVGNIRGVEGVKITLDI